MQKKYVCYNEDIKRKINKLINFINTYRWKNKHRDNLLQLLSMLESLLYVDYNNKVFIKHRFVLYCQNIRLIYESLKQLFSKTLRKDIYSCIEYFDSVAVMLELSKDGRSI